MVVALKPPAPIKNLVISGAGGLGYVLLGMAQALEDNGQLSQLEKVIGTSAGAMMGQMIALGYRGDELKDIALKQDFGRITDLDAREVLRIPFNIMRRGIFSGRELQDYTEYLTARRTGMPEMSFQQLHEHIAAAKENNLEYFKEAFAEAQSQEKKFAKKYRRVDAAFRFDFASPEEMMAKATQMKDLYVITSERYSDYDKTDNPYREVRISHENAKYADMPIAQGILFSASFPYVFREQYYKNKPHRDGGLRNNYPLEVSDGPDGTPNQETLCLGVDVIKQPGAEPGRKMRLFERIAGFLWPEYRKTKEVFLKHRAEELADVKDMERTWMAKVEGDVVDLNLPPQRRGDLFSLGYDFACNQMEERGMIATKPQEETIVYDGPSVAKSPRTLAV